jgi:hypothetical protein
VADLLWLAALAAVAASTWGLVVLCERLQEERR